MEVGDMGGMEGIDGEWGYGWNGGYRQGVGQIPNFLKCEDVGTESR